MWRIHPAFFLFGLLAAGTLLALWAFHEARQQREQTSQILATEAILLARSLGPGLVAAQSAVREVDEQVTGKLLDNARILADLAADSDLDAARLDRTLLANGLETLALLDADGRLMLQSGEGLPAEEVEGALEVCRGDTEELLFGSSIEDGIEHLAVAVAVRNGGALLARIHTESARTLVQRLGVENLLRELVGESGVLYLAYESTHGHLPSAQASWDDGPIPAPLPNPSGLRQVRGVPTFEVTVPLELSAGENAVLRVGLAGGGLEQASVSAMRRTFLVGVVLLGFSLAAAGFAFVYRARAIERAEASRRIAEAETARRRSERLAAAGALTAGLAHEVRSPLNAIGLAAQRIARKHDGESECGDFAQRIRAEVHRLESILRQFLDLARPVGLEREPTDLAQLAREVQQLLALEADSRGVELLPPAGQARARVDPGSMRRALINLLRNSIEASPDGGQVETLIEQDALSTTLRVLDRGSGIEDQMREEVFEAFVTTRATGTGLGLSLVRRVAEEHDGSCRLIPREGGGTEACLNLPTVEESPQ